MRATLFTVLATTGGTINWSLIIGGGILVVLGIAAVVYTRLRRRSGRASDRAEDETTH